MACSRFSQRLFQTGSLILSVIFHCIRYAWLYFSLFTINVGKITRLIIIYFRFISSISVRIVMSKYFPIWLSDAQFHYKDSIECVEKKKKTTVNVFKTKGGYAYTKERCECYCFCRQAIETIYFKFANMIKHRCNRSTLAVVSRYLICLPLKAFF